MTLTLSRKHKVFAIGFAGLFVLAAATWIAGNIPYLVIGFPTNDRDNRDPAKRAEMLRITLDVCDLAALPEMASDVRIWTEGNQFTRRFHVKFSADEKTVGRWLNESKGIRKAEITREGNEVRYVLKPREGWQYGDVLVNPSAGKVHIYVAWS